MWTLGAFSESQNEAGAFAKMAGVVDQHLKVDGDDITVPSMNQLIGMAAFVGANGDAARLTSPTIRKVSSHYIVPVTLALFPAGTKERMFNPQNPLPLVVDEALNAENNATPGGAERHTVVFALADGPVTPVTGNMITILATTTVALLAGEWAYAALDFPEDLPIANWTVVGARVEAATAVAFRLVPPGGDNRPGGLCTQDQDDLDIAFQRSGGLGAWCGFITQRPPGIEILSSAAAGSSTYDVYLDIAIT